MRIKPKKIAKGLYGDNATRYCILILARSLEKTPSKIHRHIYLIQRGVFTGEYLLTTYN
jgi:hypothetical protein